MARPLGLGDTVLVQLYNTTEGRRVKTGKQFTGRIIDIDYQPKIKNHWQRLHERQCRSAFRLYCKGRASEFVWVWKYEIIRRVKNANYNDVSE